MRHPQASKALQDLDPSPDVREGMERRDKGHTPAGGGGTEAGGTLCAANFGDWLVALCLCAGRYSVAAPFRVSGLIHGKIYAHVDDGNEEFRLATASCVLGFPH